MPTTTEARKIEDPSQTDATPQLTGAQIMFDALTQVGGTTIFGIPGGTVLAAYDEMSRTQGIRFYLSGHEQEAGHSAEGYARASGKPGVAFVTSGPGATNTLTPIANAAMDGTPLVVIAGQVATNMLGKGAFQECAFLDMAAPHAKKVMRASKAEEIADAIFSAFETAQAGRPGPVAIEITQDAFSAKADAPDHAAWAKKQVAARVKGPSSRLPPAIYAEELRDAVEILSNARRPLIISGGVKNRSEIGSAPVRALAETLDAAVCTTLQGIGTMPSDDPRCLKMIGMHGTFEANEAAKYADAILVVNARMNNRVIGNPEEFRRGARIIHVDIDPTAIGKTFEPHVGIVADSATVMRLINKKLIDHHFKPKGRAAWWDKINEFRAVNCLGFQPKDDVIVPQHAISEVAHYMRANIVGKRPYYVSTEVGQNQMLAAQYLPYQFPAQFVTSGGHGTMGFGFPAAIGASAAFPDALSLCIAGDGSLRMNIQALETPIREGREVKMILLNNDTLGMVAQQQRLFYDGNQVASIYRGQPDFVAVARAFNWQADRATRPEELPEKIEAFFKTPGCAMLEIKIEQQADIYPTRLASGRMILPPGGKEHGLT